MFSKNKVLNVVFLSLILLISLISRAEELIELPLTEMKKTENDLMWDNADKVFDKADQPLINPEKPNTKSENTTKNNSLEQKLSNQLTESYKVDNKELVDKTSRKKLPIGKTNAFSNNNFKSKSIPEYMKYKLIGENKNLPPVYFESNLVNDAFKAVSNNDLNNLRYLIKNYDLENFVDKYGDNLLLFAAKKEQLNALRMLIVNHYDINFLNTNKMSALHIAVLNQDLNMVKTLLTMKINTSLKDIDSKTALDYAKEINSEIADFIVTYLK